MPTGIPHLNSAVTYANLRTELDIHSVHSWRPCALDTLIWALTCANRLLAVGAVGAKRRFRSVGVMMHHELWHTLDFPARAPPALAARPVGPESFAHTVEITKLRSGVSDAPGAA
jgi:hypothetical protein